MTDTDATTAGEASLTHLSDVLNRLTGTEILTISETADERQKLANMATAFNGVSRPAAEKLAEALPAIRDVSSRWITAKMLRDSGMANETEGAFALTALSTALATEKDSGSRHMIAALVRDLGIKHDGLAVDAAAAISGVLARETDTHAKGAERNSLMAIGMKHEAAAAIAVTGIAKQFANETDPYTRIRLSGDLRDLGVNWPSQAGAVVTNLSKAAAKEKDVAALRQITQRISDVALTNPGTVPAAVETLAAGMAKETKSEAIFGYSHALMVIGKQHPMPVIAAIDKDFDGFKDSSHKDQRRAAICNLSALADIGPGEAEACSKVLIRALKDEPEAFHRRLILSGLTVCLQNRVDSADIKQALADRLPDEKDRETREQLQRMLRSLNHSAPASPNVVPMPLIRT